MLHSINQSVPQIIIKHCSVKRVNISLCVQMKDEQQERKMQPDG